MRNDLEPKLIRSAAIAVAVLTATLPQPWAIAETDRSFETSGTCTIAGVVIHLDPERVRRHLPEGVEPGLDPNGKARMQLEFFSCNPFTVDGDGGDERIGSVAAVLVEPMDGSGRPVNCVVDTCWGYDLWHAQSRHDFHSSFRGIGGFSGMVSDATFEVEQVGGLEIATSSIPWGYSTYDVEITTGARPPAAIPDFGNGFHYQIGQHGLIRITYPLTNVTGNAGVGELHAAPGSPLADLVGDTTVTGLGLILKTDFKGIHQLIGPQE